MFQCIPLISAYAAVTSRKKVKSTGINLKEKKQKRRSELCCNQMIFSHQTEKMITFNPLYLRKGL